MRVNPTVTWITREALEDLEFDGLEIAKGTTIHLLSGAAGSDPRAFSEPAFDITAQDRPRTTASAAACTTASATSSPAAT